MFLDGSAASQTQTEETSPWLGVHSSVAYPEEYKKPPTSTSQLVSGMVRGHAMA